MGSSVRARRHAAGAAAVIAAIAGSAGAQVSFQTVAYVGNSGQYGPGLGAGLAFSDLSGGSFHISPTGQVMFRGGRDASNSGVWLWNGTSNTALVQTGQASPDGGVFGNSFNLPVRNAANHWVFRENAGGTAKLFADVGSGLQVLARATDVAPGTGGAIYSNIGTPSPSLNAVGATLFQSSLSGTGVVISGADANNTALFVGTPGAVSMAVRQNDPTGIADVEVGSFTGTSLPVAFNDSSRYLAVTNLQGLAVVSGAAAGNDQGLITNRNGSLEIIARRGSTAAGAADNANYRVISSPTFNKAGNIAFLSTLRDGGVGSATNHGAVFSDASGSLSMVARATTAMPASIGVPGANFGNTFSDLVMNASGRVAFKNSGITGPGISVNVNDSMIITGDTAADLSVVVQAGTQAADLPAGVNYSSFSSGLAINTLGQLAFTTNLAGTGVVTGPTGNNLALFATDPNGIVRLVARKGAQWEAEPGVFKQITNISNPATAGGQDARLTSFNDAGQLVFGLTFADSTTGIYVATVIPTPGSIALGSLALLGVAARRRRTLA